MRIWDTPCNNLCRQHLLGEHRELHCIWTVIIQKRTGGYSNHPETNRWRKHLPALFARHAEQVREMKRRGWNHKSNLDGSLIATNEDRQSPWEPPYLGGGPAVPQCEHCGPMAFSDAEEQ